MSNTERIISSIDNKIINSIENYKSTKPSFLSNINWKIILVIGLILLAVIIFFLAIFRNFLKKNIKDDIFYNVLDIVYILLIVNIGISIFTITNYYYRISKVGVIGPPGIQGPTGNRGLDKKCNIFKKRINTFKNETPPKNLIQRFKNNYIPPPQTSDISEKNNWYLCIDSIVNKNKPDEIIHKRSSFSKLLTNSNCLNYGSCFKVSNYSPPNNKPITGCIINYDKRNNIIHAIQFTYDDDSISLKKSSFNNTKLVGIDNTCYELSQIINIDKENNTFSDNPEKYIIKTGESSQEFTENELNQLYTPINKYDNNRLNFVCNNKDFYKQFNIAYISFKQSSKNKYKFAGTAIYKNGNIVFKENYIPKYLCKPCRFDEDQERFVNNCNAYDSDINKCVVNNCIWKDYTNNQCSYYDEEKCGQFPNICKFDNSNNTCTGITRCEGGDIGNHYLPYTVTDSFKAPLGSAIYKIETYTTLDDGVVPGRLKGIKFYCRDIITSDDVFIKNSNGKENLNICFGYDIEDDYDNTKFSNININSFTAPISVSHLDDNKVNYYPSFISSTSVLYDNISIIGIEINSCVYYKN